MTDYPSMRRLIAEEGITRKRIKMIARTATGINYSESAIDAWFFGRNQWPAKLHNPIYRFLELHGIRMTRERFAELMTMNTREIRNAEAKYDRRNV